MLAALNWLRCPELHEALALLVPCSAAASRQPSPLGQAGMKRMSFATELGEDAKLEDSCQRAYNTVLGFELAQRLDAGAMVPEYTAEREALIGSTFKLAGQFELADEVVFDAVLLMDRVMSTGTAHDTALGGLFVAAALRVRWYSGWVRLLRCKHVWVGGGHVRALTNQIHSNAAWCKGHMPSEAAHAKLRPRRIAWQHFLLLHQRRFWRKSRRATCSSHSPARRHKL